MHLQVQVNTFAFGKYVRDSGADCVVSAAGTGKHIFRWQMCA